MQNGLLIATELLIPLRPSSKSVYLWSYSGICTVQTPCILYSTRLTFCCLELVFLRGQGNVHKHLRQRKVSLPLTDAALVIPQQDISPTSLVPPPKNNKSPPSIMWQAGSGSWCSRGISSAQKATCLGELPDWIHGATPRVWVGEAAGWSWAASTNTCWRKLECLAW